MIASFRHGGKGTNSLIGWIVEVAAYIHYMQRTNPKLYQAWLAKRTTPSVPRNKTLLVVYSTLSVPRDQIIPYMRRISSQERDQTTTVVLVTDGECAELAETMLGGIVDVVVRDALSICVVVNVVRELGLGFDHSMLLAPGAVAAEPPHLGHQGAVLGYGDEDVIDARGARSRPNFKPSFSIDLLLEHDYLSSGLIMSRGLVERLPTDDITDHWSLALHLVERADYVEHVPYFTVHRLWQTQPNLPEYLPYFVRRRFGEASYIERCEQRWAVRFAAPNARVSVIIPTRDRLDMLKPCVEGIIDTCPMSNVEIIVVDNDSKDSDTLAWLEWMSQEFTYFQHLRVPGEFHWGRINNLGMERATGDVFVFLNNDTLPRCSGWLERLAEVACRGDVGVVGALLVYPSERIQHAGIVIGLGDGTGHVYRGIPVDSHDHPFVDPHLTRNVSAVTGACMAVSRCTAEAIGNFDESFVVACGDVEYCLRAKRSGLLNVYLPAVSLYHMESQSRGRKDPPSDVERMLALVHDEGADPYYNVNLSTLWSYPYPFID